MNKNNFDILDNSMSLRNLTSEQKRSVARLMELAIDEARKSFRPTPSPILRWGGWVFAAGFIIGALFSAAVIGVL
jgi:hypothetical protein